MRCITGCGRKAVQQHHVIYRQALRASRPRGFLKERAKDYRKLERDPRNLVPVCVTCHELHHRFSAQIPLSSLPSSCFEFAGEVLGAGAAYEYLKRRYFGDDVRLTSMLETDDD